MWCYQRPGYEALLLTELQRQQQCSQFCDTLLKAEGVSVPAHSCVLSAISPHISSALSSTPSPPTGQSRHLEFRALGACTLLHLVRLLYSGEMEGEGENEKQQAIFAAAKLGINGLVEVTKGKSRGKGGGANQYVDVGVQTEEREEGQSRWRREVRDGSICLWKETLSGGERDMWTQTEEMNSFPPAESAASFQTIDMSVLQSSGQTDSHPFVPITLIYPPNGLQTVQVSSDVPAFVQETAGSTSVADLAAPYTSVSSVLPQYSRQTEPSSCWSGPHAGSGGDLTAAEDWEDGWIEQFEGNITGFINYFLNSENKQGACRGRAARRQRGARRARTGQQRTRRPRGRLPGRGHRGFTQIVDVQEIGVGNLQKMFLHRWGVKTPRTGRGGGAVGRKLSMKAREAPQPGRRCPRRRGRGSALEVSQSGDRQQCGEGRGRNTRRGQKNPPKQINQFYSGPPLPTSNPSLPPSLSHNLLSPASSYASPASSLYHTTRLPPPAPPPPEDQSNHINRFLEEFVMGLNILPENSNGAAHSDQPANSASSSSEDQQQVQVPDSEALVLQCEGELNSVLENFLQSFEQHVELCNTTEAERGSSENNQHTVQLQHKHTPRPVSSSETSEPHEASSSKHAQNHEGRTRKGKRRRAKQYLFSFEKMRTKKSVDNNQKDQQLQRVPVVKLQRDCLLPANVMLQESKSPSLEDEVTNYQRPSETKTGVSSAKKEFLETKRYPIRSRIRAAQITDFVDLLVEPLSNRRIRKKTQSSVVQAVDSRQQQSERHRGDLTVQTCAARGNKRGAESDEGTIQDPAPNKRIQLDQLTASESEEYDPPAMSTKQRALIDLETISLASLLDFFQETAQEKEPNGETEERSAGEEMKNRDYEMVYVDGDEETLRPERPPNCLSHAAEGACSVPPSHPANQIHLNRTGKCEEDTDEDIDVIGGSSPVPDPVVISWTESSDGEEGGDEEVDVVGEKHEPLVTAVSNDPD